MVFNLFKKNKKDQKDDKSEKILTDDEKRKKQEIKNIKKEISNYPIYVMDKKFLNLHKQANKAKNIGVIIIISGIILFIIIGFLFWYLFFYKEIFSYKPHNKIIKKPIIQEPLKGPAKAKKDANIIKKINHGPNVKDKSNKKVNLPAIDEKPTSTQQIIKKASSSPTKIASSTKATTTKQDNINIEKLIKSVDSDKDGLTDIEETLLNTNLSKSDSDGDGYSDKEELINLYDPNKKGGAKLSNSGLVSIYNNTDYTYSIFYPKKWKIKKVNQNLTMFISLTNEFIQVLVTKNLNHQTIEQWYKEQFNLDNIPQNGIVLNKNEEGIKSPDRLSVYFTDGKKDNIYCLSYNIVDKNQLVYPTIFEMMIQSFVIY